MAVTINIGTDGGDNRPWYEKAIEQETQRRLAQQPIMWGPGVQRQPTQPWTPQQVDWRNPWQIPAQAAAQQPYMPMIWKGMEPTAPAAQPTWRQPIDWAKPWGIPEQYRVPQQPTYAEAGAPGAIADYAERRVQARQQELAGRTWGQPVDWREPFQIPPASSEDFQRRVFEGYGFTPEAQRALTEQPAGATRKRITEQIIGKPLEELQRLGAPEEIEGIRWARALEEGPPTFGVRDLTARGGGGGWFPWYADVALESAQDEAALHEMTHAWADLTGLYDKEGHNLAFRRAVQRLAKEADPRYSRAAQLAYAYEHGWEDWPGMEDNDAERFAGLASGVMGDMNQLPPYVRKFYEGLFTGQGVRVGLKAPEPQMTKGQPDMPQPTDEEIEAWLAEAVRPARPWLPLIRKAWPGAAEAAPPGVLPEYFYPTPGEAEGIRQPPAVLPTPTREQELQALGAVPAEVLGAPITEEPLPSWGEIWTAAKAVPVVGIVPRTIEEAVTTVIKGLQQPAYLTERALGYVELFERERFPWLVPALRYTPAEEIKQREQIASQLREADLAPRERLDLARTSYTWIASPDRLGQALDDMKKGATIDQVARKYEQWMPEAIGQIILDPLNVAGMAIGKVRNARMLNNVRTQYVDEAAKALDVAVEQTPLFKRALRAIGGKVDDLNPFTITARSQAKALNRDINSFTGMVIASAESKSDAKALLRAFVDAPDQLPAEFGTFVKSPAADEVRKAFGLMDIDKFKSLKAPTAQDAMQLAMAGLEPPTAEFKVMDFLSELYDKSTQATSKLYGVKPPTTAEQWASGFKAYAGDFYFSNVGALAQNFSGNVAFAAYDGVMSFERMKDCENYLERAYGFIPMQARRGLTVQEYYAPAEKGIPGLKQLASAFRKVYTGDSILGEAGQRIRQTVAYMRRFDGRYWQPGPGGLMDLSAFDDLWPMVDPSNKAELIAAWRQAQSAEELLANTNKVLDGGLMASRYLDDAEEVTPGFVQAVQEVLDDARTADGAVGEARLRQGAADLTAEVEKRVMRARQAETPITAEEVEAAFIRGAVKPKEAVVLPEVEYAAELAAGRPPEIAQRMYSNMVREQIEYGKTAEGLVLSADEMAKAANEIGMWEKGAWAESAWAKYISKDIPFPKDKMTEFRRFVEQNPELAVKWQDYLVREMARRNTASWQLLQNDPYFRQIVGALPLEDVKKIAVAQPAVREELAEILEEVGKTLPPGIEAAPANIGDLALRYSIDPATATREDWAQVLRYAREDFKYHETRMLKEGIASIVDKKAERIPQIGELFGETAIIRKGRMSARQMEVYRQSLKPAEMTWKKFYDFNGDQAQAFDDLIVELQAILELPDEEIATTLAKWGETWKAPEGYPRPEVWEIPVERITPERLPTAPERVTPLLPPGVEPEAEALTRMKVAAQEKVRVAQGVAQEYKQQGLSFEDFQAAVRKRTDSRLALDQNDLWDAGYRNTQELWEAAPEAERGLDYLAGQEQVSRAIAEGATLTDDFGYTWRPVTPPKGQYKNFVTARTRIEGREVGFEVRKFTGWQKQRQAVETAMAAAPPTGVVPGEAVEQVVVRGAVNRAEASAFDLAADYKARGVKRQAAYSQFVKDRNLKPEMNAKEFFGLYDEATPRILEGLPETVGFKATHFDTVKQQPVMVTQAENQHRLTWPDGSTGGYPGKQPLPERFVPTEKAAGIIPGELPAMPPLEAAVPGVRPMEAPPAAARGEVALGRGAEAFRKAEMEELAAGAPKLFELPAEEVITPAMRRTRLADLQEEITKLTLEMKKKPVSARSFYQKQIAQHQEEIAKLMGAMEGGTFPKASDAVGSAVDAEKNMLRRLIDDETGAVRLGRQQVEQQMRPIPDDVRQTFVDRVQRTLVPARNDANMAKLQWSYEMVNRNIHDYDKMFDIDRAVGLFWPYHFWPTRTAYQSAIRMVTKPWTITSYYKIAKAIENYNREAGFPQRYGKTALFLPVPEAAQKALPEWAEPTMPIDIMPFIYPHTSVFPFNYLSKINWDDNEEAKGALDMVARLEEIFSMSPHMPIKVAIAKARGKEKEVPYFVPQTAAIKGITAYLKEKYPEQYDWVPPGGLNIEAPVRRALGMPEVAGYEAEYWPESMILDMAANREIGPDEAKALTTPGLDTYHTGPIWDEAVNRASILKNLPSSIRFLTGFRPGLIPSGEMKLREFAREEITPLYEREEAGEKGPAIRDERRALYDANPWYIGRGLLWTPGPQRVVDYREEQFYDKRNPVYDARAAELNDVPLGDWRAKQAVNQKYQGKLDALDTEYSDLVRTPSFWGWTGSEIETYYEDEALRPVADAYYAIQPENYTTAGEIDWDKFYKAQEDFLAQFAKKARPLLDKGTLKEMGITSQVEKLSWLTSSRFEKYLRRNDDPKEALWKVYKDTVITPAQNKMYAEVEGLDSTEKNAIFEKYYTNYSGRPATDFIHRIIAAYPERGWTYDQLRAEYEGILLPGLEETRRRGQSPRDRAISDLWDFYMALPALDKKRLKEGLGDRFGQLFVNKETRNYNAITDDELIHWMSYMGLDPGLLPEMAEARGAAVKAAEAQLMDEWGMYEPQGIGGGALPEQTAETLKRFAPSAPELAVEYDQALSERNEMWAAVDSMLPNYSELMDVYSGLKWWQFDERAALKEQLDPAWRFMDTWKMEHPTMVKWFYPTWQPYTPTEAAPKKAAAPGAAKQPTKQEVLKQDATAWVEFADTFTDKGLLELLQSYLLLSESQRGWFLARNPELAAWLRGQDAEWLGKLKQSLGAHLSLTGGTKRGYAWRRAPTLRWYKSW